MTKTSLESQQNHVLISILREARDLHQNGQKLLAVFDLDSTLFDLTLRVARIVESFGDDSTLQAKFSAEIELLESIEIRSSDWGLREPLERIGITESSHSDFFHALHRHWVNCFFSDDFLHHDEPLPGAVEFVNGLRQLGANIMYLSGRDIPRMLTGTEQSLRSRGFPINKEDSILVLKPKPEMDDATFKVKILKDAERHYSKIWFFENEPVNLNLTAKECPKIGLVFIDSVHSGREEVDETLDTITHFEVDSSEFKELNATMVDKIKKNLL